MRWLRLRFGLYWTPKYYRAHPAATQNHPLLPCCVYDLATNSQGRRAIIFYYAKRQHMSCTLNSTIKRNTNKAKYKIIIKKMNRLTRLSGNDIHTQCLIWLTDVFKHFVPCVVATDNISPWQRFASTQTYSKRVVWVEVAADCTVHRVLHYRCKKLLEIRR